MATTRKFKSDAFESIHATAEALHSVGVIDKATMRHFDESCLTTPPPIPPAEIKRLRERNKVSQPVFARYLSTSESTVKKWESGAKKPSAPSLKLLSLVDKHGIEILA